MSSTPKPQGRPGAFAATGAFVALGVLGVALGAATCNPPRPETVALGAHAVRRVSLLGLATDDERVLQVAGDFVLEGPRLRAVVGGLARAGEARGAVLERALITPAGEVLAVGQLSPRVELDGHGAALETTAIWVVERLGRPALHLEGFVRVGDDVVRAEREIAIGRSETTLTVTTRLHASRALRMRVGARIAWGGATPFVPGLGPLEDDAWHGAEWIGTDSPTQGSAFADHAGAASVRAVFERHGSDRFLQYTEVLGPATEGAELESRETFALGAGGLFEAVRRVGWASGTPYPEGSVRLPHAPEGSVIEVFAGPSRAPWIVARPDAAGRSLVPLPRGDRALVATATAYGHAHSDETPITPGTRTVLEIPEGGRLRVSAQDAETGQRLLARVRILGTGATQSSSLGPDSRAAGAGDALLLADTSAVVELQPGTYRVIVTHGPEWTLHDQRVEVTPTFRPEVRASLSRVVDAGEWVPCDFHVHAAPSPDSDVTLEDRVRSLHAEGIRFVVPTDHNHVTDYAETVRALELSTFGTVPGVEVTTWEPNFGHFNAFPVALDPRLEGNGAPQFTGITPASLFDSLHALGPDVVVQINHPRLEGDIGYFERAGLDPALGLGTGSFPYVERFDAVEVWNGFDLARAEPTERVFQDWLRLLSRGVHVVATGNSDSHKVRYQWAGYPRTYVRVPRGDATDVHAVIAALRAGRAFVTSGLFLEATIDEHGPGDTVTVRDGRVAVHVTLRAPPWMDTSSIELWTGAGFGRVALVGQDQTATMEPTQPPAPPRRGRPSVTPPARPAPLLRYEGTLELTADADTFVVVRARGTQPMNDYFGRSGIPPIAFTNPIWIDVDGDGIAAPPLASDAGAPPLDAGLELASDVGPR